MTSFFGPTLLVGPKNLLFPQRIADLKDKQILRCAQDDSIAVCYAATLKLV